MASAWPPVDGSSERCGNPFAEHAIQLAVAAALVQATNDGRGNGAVLSQLRRDPKNAAVIIESDGIPLIIGCLSSPVENTLRKRGLPLSALSLALLPPFSPITANPAAPSQGASAAGQVSASPELAKTGLGSSAAMTTSMVAGLLLFLGAVELPRGQSLRATPDDPAVAALFAPASSKQGANPESTCEQREGGAGFDDGPRASEGGGPAEGTAGGPGGGAGKVAGPGRELVHAIAQAAHCAAQGKVGSGFDVSAAVFGSQRYVRFAPHILAHALKPEGNGASPADVARGVMAASFEEGAHCSPFQLPPGLILGLAAANLRVEQHLAELRQLAAQHAAAYSDTLQACSTLSADEWGSAGGSAGQLEGGWAVAEALLRVRSASEEVRALLREMGNGAAVPIEPEAQTELLDASMRVPGVLIAGVPGAGGYDAVFAVVLGPEVRTNLDEAWGRRGVLALEVEEDSRGVFWERM
eukprot:jgi/Mesen1/8720/ME000052S08146